MLAFKTEVIPIDDLLVGKPIDWKLMRENAKRLPLYFTLELFALMLMVVGAYTICTYLYEAGKAFGRFIA